MAWGTLAKWGIRAAAVYFGGKAFNLWGNDEPVQQQQQQPQQPAYAPPQAYPPQYQQYPQYMNPDFSSNLFGMKYQNDIFAGPMFAQMMGGYGQPQYQYPPVPQQQLI